MIGGVGMKMSWVEKNQKMNNPGASGDDYSGLEIRSKLSTLKKLIITLV